MSTALWYWAFTANERNQRYIVVAIMLASAKERPPNIELTDAALNLITSSW